MPTILLFTHITLCVLAIGSGALVLWDLLSNRLVEQRSSFFLRCSLGSNVAALLFELHRLLPSQYISMVAVYCTGIGVLAWRKFHLRGAWSAVFAFAVAVVFYLNLLALSIQVYVHALLLSRRGPVSFWTSQVILLAIFLLLGTVASKRFSPQEKTRPAPIRPDAKRSLARLYIVR